ncbi:MAG TPA: M3 family metallopeptidase [Opitutaceae bacterium]|nr:M3 family metallopeptidase [Opitutaceae bacterium]
MSTNPFLEPTFFIPWSALTSERVAPAIETALEHAQSALDQVATIPPADASFESAFMGLENATEELNLAWGKVNHLTSVADSPALRETYNALLPKVSEFYARIALNDGLWRTLKAAADKPEVKALTGIRRRFVDETLADFRQAGADLPADKKARLEKVQSELAQLTQKYSENVLDSTNAWQLVIEDESRLKGLPAHAKESARRNALTKGMGTEEQPKWRFTLHMPSLEPLMTYAEDESLRKEMWEASTAIGAHGSYDNSPLITQILRLRKEKAVIMGRPHFANLVLERRMAKQGTTALHFIEDLHRRVHTAFERECTELETFKAEQTGKPAGRLAPWEVGFWSEKLRQARYAFDEEQLRPYFRLDQVVNGLFDLVGRIFCLKVVPHEGSVDVWHPEVKVYDLFDRTDRHLGSFYTDWHPRESKRGGAWMNHLITGGPRPDGVRAPHLGLMCGNMTPPVGDRPALLTHREVETVFHEFGHLLHHLLGEVEIKSLNGVNVAWDFVELPSQIMENWTWERDGLDLFARHYQTGETIPDDLFKKMIAARNFRSACMTMRQLAFARMDLMLHLQTEKFLESDLESTLRAELAAYTIPTEPPAPTISRRFTHIFSDPVGYAAGYYSYKWAEVLDADAFSRFQREGIFNEKVGREFVDKILSRGNSDDPMKLYVDFMGRQPDLQALLKRAGLAA